MKTVIVCASVAHGNTRRVAEAMAGVLDARIVTPEEADPAELAGAGLLGFGSGVYYGRLHPGLAALARRLPAGRGRAFVFATSGLPEPPFAPYARPLTRLLGSRGVTVEAAFSCRAYDTWGPFGLVGGIRRHRPGPADLAAARAFAEGLRQGGPR
ncbi:flavodoxin [Streptomyces sp. NPDC089919]|uniref:flavodoxin n=1 Tax=Streptomyces sp. NPDC089919 TaxID=3155188 RepID=UPI0034203D2F